MTCESGLYMYVSVISLLRSFTNAYRRTRVQLICFEAQRRLFSWQYILLVIQSSAMIPAAKVSSSDRDVVLDVSVILTRVTFMKPGCQPRGQDASLKPKCRLRGQGAVLEVRIPSSRLRWRPRG